MRRLDLASASFLATESKNTPMHIGGLSVFRFPDGAGEEAFLQKLSTKLRDVDEFRAPFAQQLHTTPAGVFWKNGGQVDIDYHFLRSGLPQPGGMSELFALTSRLHGTALDRDRPLWEQHGSESRNDRAAQ